MLDLRPSRSREHVVGRVRPIVAEQMARDPFEVKLTDSLDHELGIAGDDVDAIFAAIASEFGTGFSELAAHFDLYFYPEVAVIDGTRYGTLLAISGFVGAAYAALHGWLPHIVNRIAASATLAIAVTLSLVVRNQRGKPSASSKTPLHSQQHRRLRYCRPIVPSTGITHLRL